MTSDQLIDKALAFPLSERVTFAQARWESIGAQIRTESPAEERAALSDAIQRAAELDSAAVEGRSHEQVMAAARRVLRCD